MINTQNPMTCHLKNTRIHSLSHIYWMDRVGFQQTFWPSYGFISFHSEVFSLDNHLTCFVLCKWLYFIFYLILQNLILLIAFCYWQYFSVFTSYLALAKAIKNQLNHLKNMMYLSPNFSAIDLHLYKHFFKINVPGNMYTYMQLLIFVLLKKTRIYIRYKY